MEKCDYVALRTIITGLNRIYPMDLIALACADEYADHPAESSEGIEQSFRILAKKIAPHRHNDIRDPKGTAFEIALHKARGVWQLVDEGKEVDPLEVKSLLMYLERAK